MSHIDHSDDPYRHIRRRTRLPVRPSAPADHPNEQDPPHSPANPDQTADGSASAPKPPEGRRRGRAVTARARSDYEVGYGKPPKSGQFQKGRSANPKGRPKASRNARTIIRDAIFQSREVTIDGKKVRMSQFEIGIQQLMQKFMKGDAKAASQVLALFAKYQELGGSVTGDEPGTSDLPALTDSGKRMLSRYQSNLLRAAGISDEQIGMLLESLGLPPLTPDDGDGGSAADGLSGDKNGEADDGDLPEEGDDGIV